MDITNAKYLNVRIQNKIHDYDSWIAADPVLLHGEIALVEVAAAQDGVINTVPSVMMKVGDGEHKFSELGWVYARSSDTYAWARAKDKPSYEAGEITGIDEYISNYVSGDMGLVGDTDTQYTIVKVSDYQYKLMSKAKGDEEFTAEVAVIDIPNDTEAIENLEQLVGSVDVATQIANAIAELDLANTYEAKGEAAAKFDEMKEYVDSKAVQSDWSQNDESAADYVKNRTHYESGEQTLIVELPLTTIYNESQGTKAYMLPDGTYDKFDASQVYQMRFAGATYDLVTHVDEVTGELDQLHVNNVYLPDGQSLGYANLHFDETNSSVVLRFGEAGNKDIASYTVEIYQGKLELKQLDEKFIPDTIARVSDVEAVATRVTTAEGNISTIDGRVSANEEAIAAIKDGESIDSFADVEAALANVEAGGAASDALEQAKAYADEKDAPISETAEAAKSAAEAAQADVDALEKLVGTLPEGATAETVVAYVDEKTAGVAMSADLTALAERVETAEGAIDAIEADYLKAADKTELSEAIAAAEESAVDRILGYLSEETVNEKFDTLKEVAAWIEADTTASAELITRVSNIEADYLKGADKTELQGAIDDLEAFVGELPEGAASTTVVAYIQEVVDALKIGDYAKAADLTALTERVVALEGKSHEHANKALLDTYTQTEENLASAVAQMHTHENASVLSGITAEKVAAWDTVSEKANDADLSAIAKSGNVNDLVQTEGEYIIFNCGTSTTVI